MRTSITRPLMAVSLLGFAAFLGSACSHDKCDILPCGPVGAGGTGGDGGSGEGGAGGTGGDGGGGGTIDPGCIPSMLPAGAAVPPDCGVFVTAGATGAGTQSDPTGDLAAALTDVPANKAVYVCGTDTFNGTFALAGGRSVFGGLSCADWTYDPASRPKLLGSADSATLTVSGSGTTRVEDVLIENPNAVAAGASSIGVIVDGPTMEIARCEITTGDGADGAAGTAPVGTGTAGSSGATGGAGCLNTTTVNGAMPVTLACGADSSVGGRGGDGTNLGGFVGNGTPGDSDPQVSSPVDNHGSGQTSGMSCTSGTQGADGAPGSAGLGATGVGALSTSGFTSPLAQAGLSNGQPGQGGGGGGGARGASVCSNTTHAGHAGGGGGTGGCGGQVGAAGQGGGASIAIALVAGVLDATDTSLFTGAGGDGGAGSAGQNGGGGGQPGLGGGSGACPGGLGGSGGRGGSGGGGLGGHSLGIAAQAGAAPTMTNVTATVGTAGSGGVGGDGGPGNQGGAGDAGERCRVLMFDTDACQMP